MDASNTIAEAVAISNGTITLVGSNKDVEKYIANSAIKVINLQGRTAMPGLIDCHMHLIEGAFKHYITEKPKENPHWCSFPYHSLNKTGVVEHLKECLKGIPENSTDWLVGFNLDYSGYDPSQGPLSRSALDEVSTTHPIKITSSDSHTFIVNSAALNVSGIGINFKQPKNGKVEEDIHGMPTGILQEEAGAALLRGVPPLTANQNAFFANESLRLLREAGITTFQEAKSDYSYGTAFDTLRSHGVLSARGYFDFLIQPGNDTCSADCWIEKALATRSKWHDSATVSKVPTMKWQAVKMFMDGVIFYPSLTGSTLEPYWELVNNSTWAPPKNGTIIEPYWSKDLLAKTFKTLIDNKMDAQIHADGDRAVHTVLDGIQQLRDSHPDVTDYKIGIAHNELTSPDDWSRFAKLNADAITSYQWPQPGTIWEKVFDVLGPNRSQYLEAYGDLRKNDARIVYGSDWPVSINCNGYYVYFVS